jgi:hypothetical protein
MKRITSNNSNTLMGEIMASAEDIAKDVPVVSKVHVSSSSIATVAELLDIDATNYVLVSDYEGVEARLAELRQDASTSVKRMLTSFATALKEAREHAERGHVTNIANSTLNILNGSGSYYSNNHGVSGRFLTGFTIDDLTKAHNALTEFLQTPTPAFSPSYGNDESEDYVTRFASLPSVYVQTTCRFALDESGDINYRYKHTLSAGEGVLYALRNKAKTLDSTLVVRRNKMLKGGVRHMEKFALWSLEQIEAELAMRTEALSEAGLNLVIEWDEFEFTPTPDPTPTAKTAVEVQ